MDSRSYTAPTAAPQPLWLVSGATTTNSSSAPSDSERPRARAAIPGANTPSSLVIRIRNAGELSGSREMHASTCMPHSGGIMGASASSPTIPGGIDHSVVRHGDGPLTRRIVTAMTSRPPTEDQRPAETTAATGDQWVIGHGEDRAVITEVGATLRSFTVGDRSLIEGFASDEWSHGGRGQVLA